MLKKHKEVCLRINGAQLVRLEKGIIEFKNYFKQIPVPWKLYADFECNFKSVESYEGSYSKSINITFLAVLVTNFVCVDDEFIKPIVAFRGEFIKVSISFVKSDEKTF